MWRIDESRSRFRLIARLIMLAWVFAAPHVAGARATPEQQCQKRRYNAGAKYTQCELKAISNAFDDFSSTYLGALSKCRTKYAATWAKIEARARGTGSTCDQSRFTVGGGMVTDNLTGLQWEQKTADGTVHDKDNVYDLQSFNDLDPSQANGTAFTSFLATLNGGGCFADRCDWRLPTRTELETILLGPYPCATSPCIDQGIFGPTAASVYWSSTPEASTPDAEWGVSFDDGFVNDFFKDTPYYVRAVRGGM
jgi:hypothetical protein